jgi:hypothetical protein
MIIELFVPIQPDTAKQFFAGDANAFDEDDYAKPVFKYLSDSGLIGDFGGYHGVLEFSIGVEMFRPSGASNPTLGKAGETKRTFSLRLVIFPNREVRESSPYKLVDELLNVHPWEHPVCILRTDEIVLTTQDGVDAFKAAVKRLGT